MAKTAFFKSCLGVFQGGGCRAAAFVGAYDEALKRGVSFTEVAGTSAGSIIASLIGAGASPADLHRSMATMDFNSFMGAPDRKAARGLSGRLLQWTYPRLADLIFDQGFHSSQQVKDWINLRLNELLPKEKHPITFSSLPFPTYIVSTDLARAEVKIWSQKTTPNEIVADAVQASCAIPIFFQPINKRHVDGGLLSNLPAFVFSEREQSERALASRILAFALVSDESDLSGWGTEAFLHLLANAVVDGSQQLQISLQRNVHVIKIPTGSVKATDFAKMTPAITTTLIENGSAATKEFFDKELLHIQPAIPSDSVCYGVDEVYTRAAESLQQPLARVIVADHNTDWVYSLFPSLLCWCTRGVLVDAILPALGDKKDGPYRRRLLRAMGVNVTEIEDATTVPLKAVVIVPQDPDRIRAIVGVEKQSSSQTIDSVLYQGFLDATVIRTVLAQLDATIVRISDATTAATPTLEADSYDALYSRLRSVSQYSKPGIEITSENVSIEKLVSLTRFVREYKYQQISHLVQLYRKADIPLFEPTAVRLNAQQRSIVTPPVVEDVGGQFVLVEGSTRATFCRDEGISSIKCIVVRGVTEQLPSLIVPFKQVRVVGRTLDARQRYGQFDYTYFRSIERAVHPFNSLD